MGARPKVVYNKQNMEQGDSMVRNHEETVEDVQRLLREIRSNEAFAENRQIDAGRRPKVMPDHYDGRTSWSEYLIHFEAVSEVNGWNSIEKKRFLAVCLRDEACLVMQSLAAEDRQNYETFIGALNRRLNPGNKVNLYRTQLRTRVRKERESLSQLAQSVRSLALSAYPNAERELFESLCCDHFLDALNDSDIRSLLCLCPPQKFDDLVAMVVPLEANRQVEQQRQGKKFVREVKCLNEDKAEKNDPLNKIEQQLVKLTDLMTSMNRNQTRQTGNGISKMRCYNCGELGHLRNRCTKPRRTESN
jgi:hypothetical protein